MKSKTADNSSSNSLHNELTSSFEMVKAALMGRTNSSNDLSKYDNNTDSTNNLDSQPKTRHSRASSFSVLVDMVQTVQTALTEQTKRNVTFTDTVKVKEYNTTEPSFYVSKFNSFYSKVMKKAPPENPDIYNWELAAKNLRRDIFIWQSHNKCFFLTINFLSF